MKKTGYKASYKEHKATRKAVGLLLALAYVINPYGLLLADDTVDTLAPGDIAISRDDQEEPTDATEPSTAAEDPATDPADVQDVVDATEPADDTDPVDDSQPTDTTDPTDPADTTDPSDATDPTDATEPTDAVDPTDATDPTDDTDATEPSQAEPDETEPTEVTEEPSVTPAPTAADTDDDQVIEDLILDSTGKTWKVTATFGSECNIPKDSSLKVKELTNGTEYRDYREKTEEYLDDRTIDYIRLFDISIVNNGIEIEPASGTQVKVAITLAQASDNDICILHFPDEKEAEVIDDVNVVKNNGTTVTFDTTGFSVFAVAGYTMEKTFEAGDGSTYKFVLTYDDKACFPDNAHLDVRELTGSEYDEYLKKTLEAVGGDAAEYARIFDVSVVTAAGARIQPRSDVKLDVTLEDAKASSDLEVVHFGSEVEQLDATKDGKVLSFTASGFSIYAIVDKSMAAPTGTGWTQISLDSSADSYVDNHLSDPATGDEEEIFISINSGYFATAGTYSPASGRYGIKKTTTATKGDVDSAKANQAVPYFIQKVGDNYYIYRKEVSGDTVTRYYVKRNADGEGETNAEKSLSFVDNIEGATPFVFGTNSYGIYIKDARTADYCWNQQGNDGGKGFCAWKGTADKNAGFELYYYVPVDDDPYDLGGESYGLMYYDSGVSGYGLMGDGSNNHTLPEMVIRTDDGSRVVYVDEDSDISIWNFENISGDNYRISTDVNGSTVYLKLDGSGNITTTSSSDEASSIRVTPGTGSNSNKIYLSCGSYYLTYNSTDGFKASTTVSSRVPLNLVEKTTADGGDSTVYSAKEVSVSDTTKVPNGAKVIVYTRVWNSQKSEYDFYAIDHDGSLYPCFERGDEIMWVGDVLDSIQWEFTEYYWEGTTDPNYYYELYNPYSDKYLAPQLNGQILSSNKIGINLEGRREGNYFTDITAWDSTYYNFAAIAVDDDAVVSSDDKSYIQSVPFSKADTFYFAILNPVETTDQLHVVETENNADHGLTMKIVDFDKDPDQTQSIVSTQYFGSTGDVKGILSTDLSDEGYPTIVHEDRLREDFKTLFTGNNVRTVDGLFLKSIYQESGYLEYSSCQNFATLKDPDTGDITDKFTVYKEIGTTDINSRRTLKHGQFFPLDTIQEGVFSTQNPQNLYSMDAQLNEPDATHLLPDSDPRKYEKLYTVGRQPNYYLGMEISASFVQTPNGQDDWGHDLIFEFLGDDDFWFYVDGELVLDLGGIHSSQKGSVNFCTGEVICNGTRTTLRDIFIANRVKRGMTQSAAVDEVNQIFISKDGGQTYQFKDYSNHETKIFYMERGAGSSNLHIRFNLAAVAPGNVLLSKKVSGDAAEDMDFDLIRYPYQIFYRLKNSTTWEQLDNEHSVKLTYQNSVRPVEYVSTFKPAGSNNTYDKVYLIDPQHSVEIDLPDGVEEYRVVECGLNTEVYDNAKINDVPCQPSGVDGHYANFDSGELLLEDNPTIFFENFVKDDTVRTLTINKLLYDEQGENGHLISKAEDDTRFSFRLSLSNGSGDSVNLTNRYKYYVVNDQGTVSKWDPATQDFVPTSTAANIEAIKALSDDEKEEITFYTSSYGSISNIPAGYSILVPGLPVGTIFEVVERENEIPKGYQLLKYEGDSETYISTGEDNSGIVRVGYSPDMTVKNVRGWGLTVNKDWSDKDYVDSYEPIYVALYENGNLIDGTVRQLSYPVTSTYYFFLRTFNDMIAREVKISNTNPTVEADGTVTDPGEVTPVEPLTKVQVNTDPEGLIEYTVDYKTGEPYGSNENVKNIREDTITNIREGALIFDLYEWASDTGLKGGKFQITLDGAVVGEYTSDASGRITTFYKFEKDRDYVLTQIESPTGFLALSQPVTFSVSDSGEVTLTDPNGEGWTKYVPETSGNGILGYVKVYNKPIALDVYKYDADNIAIPLSGAHFELYRQLYNSITGYTKSTTPMEGFEDLVTDSDGIIHITNADGSMLKHGVYYLTEKTAPATYVKVTEDVVITISEKGVVTIDGFSGATLTRDDGDDLCKYTVNFPNESDGTNTLKIIKEVTGNLGNKTDKFNVTVTLTDNLGNPLADTDTLLKVNGNEPTTVATDSEGKIVFEIKHNDMVSIIGLPDGTKFKVEEESGKYKPEFFVDNVSQGEETSASGTIPANKTVRIVNTYEGVIPTGVSNAFGVLAVMVTVAIAGFAVMIAVLRRRRQYYS